MSNLELINVNRNEAEEVALAEDSVMNKDDVLDNAQNKSRNKADSATEISDSSMSVDEEQKVLLYTSNNLSSVSENSSDTTIDKQIYSNELNEKNADAYKEDKCLKTNLNFDLKEKNQVSKATNDMINFAKGNLSIDGNACDTTLCNEMSHPNKFTLCRVLENSENMLQVKENINTGDQGNSSQLLKFNIVSNPNDFSLLEKKNATVQNSDFFNLNQSDNELLAYSDNSIVISNNNAIPQSDSIVSSNYSLSQLQNYISDDDEDSMIEELPVDTQKYRDGSQQMEDSDDDSDSSTSSSTSIVISDTSSDSESEDEFGNTDKKQEWKPIKAKGELDIGDLPPIEDLTISVPEEECIPVGKIYQIVDQLVIVQANKDTPAYDLDTVMFTQGGKPLGKVFDVMGPVTEPYYCIRFNSRDHIQEKNITLDQIVYAAPKTQYSKFVFLAQLMQLKGSDASWENDLEPPEIYLDYSDDEQEQRAKKLFKNKKATAKVDSDPDEPARKRHSAYEKRMNARNSRLNATRNIQNQNKYADGNVVWQPSLPSMSGDSPRPPVTGSACHQMFGRPPMFDSRVPLPNSSSPQFHHPEFPPHGNRFRLAGPSSPSHSQGPPPWAVHKRRYWPSFGNGNNRPCHSPGPFDTQRMSSFSTPPPFSQPPNNQGLPPEIASSWNSPPPRPDNRWVNHNPFPPQHPPPMGGHHPPPMRIPTNSPSESFPFSPGPFSMRGGPQGPPPPRPNFNRGNFAEYNSNNQAHPSYNFIPRSNK